jgi:AAA+ ATPase superfamily predicted ATPase
VAVYGRRRVGKTFLIRTVFEDRFDFQLTGQARSNPEATAAQFSGYPAISGSWRE